MKEKIERRSVTRPAPSGIQTHYFLAFSFWMNLSYEYVCGDLLKLEQIHRFGWLELYFIKLRGFAQGCARSAIASLLICPGVNFSHQFEQKILISWKSSEGTFCLKCHLGLSISPSHWDPVWISLTFSLYKKLLNCTIAISMVTIWIWVLKEFICDWHPGL